MPNTEMREMRKEVPPAVKDLVQERIESLERVIGEMITERDELKEYLKEVS